MPDMLSILTRVHDEAAEDRAALDAALERARTRYAAPAGPPTRQRPALRRGVVVGVVATLAIAAAITVTSLVVPGRSDSAAAAALTSAADAAGGEGPQTSPYVEVTIREDGLGYTSSDGEDYDEGYVLPTVIRTWVPRDRSATWVRQSWTDEPTTIYGGDATRAAAAADYAASAHADHPEVTRGKGGDFTNGELGGTPDGLLSASDLDTLPRDPAELSSVITRSARAKGESDEQHVFDVVSGLLRTGVVPADLREGMFRVLAGLPGIRITDRQATLDGRTGTAIGLVGDGSFDRTEVLIDQAAGTYLGERTVQLHRSGAIPAGTIIDSLTVAVANAGSAP